MDWKASDSFVFLLPPWWGFIAHMKQSVLWNGDPWLLPCWHVYISCPEHLVIFVHHSSSLCICSCIQKRIQVSRGAVFGFWGVFCVTCIKMRQRSVMWTQKWSNLPAGADAKAYCPRPNVRHWSLKNTMFKNDHLYLQKTQIVCCCCRRCLEWWSGSWPG